MRQIPEDDLGQVLRSVAKGDRAAFRQLYEQAGPTLFGICSRILRDRNAAEDAFQEAMLRIWQKSYLYDPARGGAMTWMVTVVRRVALDRLPARRTGTGVADRRERRGPGRGAIISGAARSRPGAGPAKVSWSAGT